MWKGWRPSRGSSSPGELETDSSANMYLSQPVYRAVSLAEYESEGILPLHGSGGSRGVKFPCRGIWLRHFTGILPIIPIPPTSIHIYNRPQNLVGSHSSHRLPASLHSFEQYTETFFRERSNSLDLIRRTRIAPPESLILFLSTNLLCIVHCASLASLGSNHSHVTVDGYHSSNNGEHPLSGRLMSATSIFYGRNNGFDTHQFAFIFSTKEQNRPLSATIHTRSPSQ